MILTSGNKISLRGLSVVDDQIIWVSGNKGTVGKSLDGGKNWNWIKVKGFDSTDFRDIEAFDDSTAIIMGISEPAYILKTIDGGDNWKVVYENKTKGMFLDAMDFWDRNNGVVIGDPIDNKFFAAATNNNGDSWSHYGFQSAAADSGEACFASSGTNIRAVSKQKVVLVTGGLRSSIFSNREKSSLPILQGRETTGANSVAVKNKKTMIVVGGDFTTKDAMEKNCFITTNAGKSWKPPVNPPTGYRSCVEWLGKKKWITCGINGVDISTDEGMHWKQVSKESFNSCRKAKKGSAVFFAGSNGRIGKLISH